MQQRRYSYTKIRHEPFSVYMYFVKPADAKSNQAIYVEGKNDNNLQVLAGDWRRRLGWMSLDPSGTVPLKDNNNPITQLGIKNLTQRLLTRFQGELAYHDMQVDIIKGAKVGGRLCTVIQVTHPVPEDHYSFHIGRVFIDDELNMPIRWASYGWPKVPGSRPPLREEYTYSKLKINNGFGDADFDQTNPDYNGKKK